MFVLLQSETTGKLDREESYVEAWAHLNGIEVRYASLSKLRKRRLSLEDCILAVGGVEFMSMALRLVNATLPEDNCYPQSVHHALGREVRPSRLYEALMVSERRPVFVKPRVRTKRFTGKVIHDGGDYWLSAVPPKEPVWVSDVLSFVAEWRFYVKGGAIYHHSIYSGDGSVVPDITVVEDVVKSLWLHDGYTDYAVDMGVDIDGRTLLVEFNDGYSVGAYGAIYPADYSEMLSNRWNQMKASPSL